MLKPFEFRELIARLRALVNRAASSDTPTGNLLTFADMEMNLDTKRVKRGDKIINLTAKEFALLEYLIRNKGRVLSKVDISEKIWDITFDTGTNVIEVYINFLRKKVDKEFDTKLIHTVVGMGYVLREE
jgi:DNA-binding response OmpR family regulator